MIDTWPIVLALLLVFFALIFFWVYSALQRIAIALESISESLGSKDTSEVEE